MDREGCVYGVAMVSGQAHWPVFPWVVRTGLELIALG